MGDVRDADRSPTIAVVRLFWRDEPCAVAADRVEGSIDATGDATNVDRASTTTSTIAPAGYGPGE